LKPDGWIVTSCVPFLNIPNYPELEEVLARVKEHKNHVLLDVEALAKEAGAPTQAANMVLLGAAIHALGIDHDKMLDGVRRVFAAREKRWSTPISLP